MPESCAKCPLSDSHFNSFTDPKTDGRIAYCPLIEAPEPKDICEGAGLCGYEWAYIVAGYNQCLKDIGAIE